MIQKNKNTHIWPNFLYLLPLYLLCKQQPQPGVPLLICPNSLNTDPTGTLKSLFPVGSTSLWTNMRNEARAQAYPLINTGWGVLRERHKRTIRLAASVNTPGRSRGLGHAGSAGQAQLCPSGAYPPYRMGMTAPHSMVEAWLRFRRDNPRKTLSLESGI